MKKISVTILFCITLTVNAQNYRISFEGTGESTTVNSVRVENLNSGATLTLNGNDILRLTQATDIYSVENTNSSGIKIYPNPMNENSLMEINVPVAGEAVITVIDLTGRQLFQKQNYLEKNGIEFTLSGFKYGLYLISVKGSNYHLSKQLLSVAKQGGTISIEKEGDGISSVVRKKSESKGAEGTIDMPYTNGNVLKFTGISGNYSTVITDIPGADKTLVFTFIACTDGDANNYPVVKIGTQTWMAENLKYLPAVVGPGTGSSKTPYYYVYGYDGTVVATAKATANYTTYGVLYNWPAAMAGSASSTANPSGVKGVCPTGWHLPSNAEWTELVDYLGGASVAGGKLKEIGTTHWVIPIVGATNETGFTALPGGVRLVNGNFLNIGNSTGWWSTTESDATYAWYHGILTNSSALNSSSYGYKRGGMSVRCVRD